MSRRLTAVRRRFSGGRREAEGKPFKRRFAVATSVAAVVVAVSATPAAARPTNPTPNSPSPTNQWCGAENMRAAGSHMAEAMMLHTAPQGDAGMFGAIANTQC